MTRRQVLAGLLVGTAGLAALVLFEVLATVFLAVTVAYLLAPVHDHLADRGLGDPWASLVAAMSAALAALVPIAVLIGLIYLRRGPLLAVLTTLPREVPVRFGGYAATLDLAPAYELTRSWLSDAAVSVAAALPVIGLKLTLFGVVLFALLIRREQAVGATLSLFPPDYRDVATALHRRIRETLYTIYVLQAVSAFATFAVALPTFALLGYRFVGTLAVVAGVLQFLPIVGPSVLILALATYLVSVGAVGEAAVVLVVGGVVVAWLPDLAVRLWLPGETTRTHWSLYFIGFVGGLLTLGGIGIVVGPLVVALLVEALDLFATQNAGGPEP
ncbi:MAG: AI-2E family transporter [Halobacteriaceae archaeon]